MATSRPIRLSDDQLDAVYRAAVPLPVAVRGAFLEYVAELLQDEAVLGDGCVFRAAQRAQARFYDPPDFGTGSGSGSPGTSKYSRPGFGRQSA